MLYSSSPCTFQCEHDGISIEGLVKYGSKRRKRIALCVKSNGQAELRLPHAMPLHAAMPFVEAKAPWLLKQIERMTTRQDKLCHTPPTPPSFQTGEQHLFKGQAYPLEIYLQTGSQQGVALEEGRLVIRSNAITPTRIHTLLHRFYREEATTYFIKRLHEYMPSIPWLNPETVPVLRIKTLRKRWGSCTRHAHITLNSHLIKVPPCCADFVLMHELAHVQELNHGQHFYELLNALMPTWRTHKEILSNYDLTHLCFV